MRIISSSSVRDCVPLLIQTKQFSRTSKNTVKNVTRLMRTMTLFTFQELLIKPRTLQLAAECADWRHNKGVLD